MAKTGKIYYSKVEFTDAYVSANYQYPVMFFITDNINRIKKQIVYDETGKKSITTYSSTETGIITIGTITGNSSSIFLSVHSSGWNEVLFNGASYKKNSADSFPYTPVSAGQIKILIIYSLPDSQIFYMAEGLPGAEAIEPELPAGALFIRRITVTQEGLIIDAETLSGFKPKAEDAWKTMSLSALGSVENWLQFSADKASSFMLSVRNATAGITVKLCGIYTNTDEALWPGKTFTIFNNTVGSVKLTRNTGTAPTALLLFPFSANTNLTLKSYQGALVKVNNNQELEVIASTSSGSASFPEGGTDGQTLVKDSTAETGVKWYSGFLDKLTTAVQTVAGLVNFTAFLKSKYYYFTSESSPDTTPGKLSANGTNVQYTNDAGVVYSLAYTNQFYKDITGDVILDDSYHNCICRITATCIITVPSGLRSDFIAFFVVVRNYTATFTEGLGITFYAPFGVNLRKGLTCVLQQSSTNNFDLIGNLSTW